MAANDSFNGKYITISKTSQTASGKTFVWTVYSHGGIALGEIKWFGQWRKYSFWPFNYTTWDNNCLNEVVAFMDKAMKERGDAE